MEISLKKGATYLIISQIIFLLSGYGIQITTGRILGPEDYGTFGIILYLLNTINLVVVSGMTKTASKFLSQNLSSKNATIRVFFKIQLYISIISFLIYFVLAGKISIFFHDTGLKPLIMISALGIPIYGVYALTTMGILNGLRVFKKQAASQIIFSLAKLVFMIALCIKFGVIGAIIGYIVASFIGFIFSFACLRMDNDIKGSITVKEIIVFSFPTSIYITCIFLMLNIDFFSLKVILGNELLTGYYNSATTIARLPYFISGALAMVLLPSVSFLLSENNISKVKRLIEKSLRYLFIFLFPTSLLISATSRNLIVFLYSGSYIEASEPLSILVFGLAILSIINILATIAIAAGKPKIVSSALLIIVLIDLFLNKILITKYEMIGAALASTVSAIIGVIFFLFFVCKEFNIRLDIKSLSKVSLSSIVVYILAIYIDIGGFFLIIEYVLLFLIYFAILYLTKELKREDFILIKEIVKK